MPKIRDRRSALISGCLAFFCSISALGADPGRFTPVTIDPLRVSNLSPEGGFDAPGDGAPSEWQAVKGEGEAGACASDDKVSHSGRASLVFKDVKGSLLLRRRIPVDPKVSYVVSCWMKSQGVYRAHGVLEVAFLDPEGLPAGPVLSQEVSADTEFIEKQIEVAAWDIPPAAAVMEIRLGVRGATPGSVWFDGLLVRPQQATIHLSSDRPSNLFHSNEPVILNARLYNCLVTDEVRTIEVTLEDLWGRDQCILAESRLLLRREPIAKRIQLPSRLGLGHFTLTATVLDKQRVVEERSVDLAVVSPFSPQVWSQDSPFGSHGLGAPPDRLVALMREAYVKWVRVGAGWGNAERKQGEYDFSGLDKAFKPYLDGGMQLLPIVSGTPQWISSYKEGMPTGFLGGTFWTYPPREYQPLTDFCERLSARFSDRIKFWEVWNEPNCAFWMGTPQDFARFLAAAFAGLRKGDPRCRVIFETAGIDVNFWDTVCRSGGQGCFDILATHNYQLSHPGPPERSPFLDGYYTMKQFLAQRGRSSIPIWDTEFCWMSSAPLNRAGWKGVGEREQAEYLVRSWMLALSAGVERMFWFPFHSYGGGELNEPHPGGLVRADYSLKPVYVAHRVMAECLAGAKFSRQLDVGKTACCYVFRKGDGEVAVVWSIDPTSSINLGTEETSVRSVDMMGNPHVLAVQEGILTLAVTSSPSYVFSKTPFGEVLGAASEEMVLRLSEIRRIGKTEGETSVIIANKTPGDLRATLRFLPPLTWPPADANEKVKIKRGRDKSRTFQFPLPPSDRFSSRLTVEASTRNALLRLTPKVPVRAQVVASPIALKNLADWPLNDGLSLSEKERPGAWYFHKVCADYDENALYLGFRAPRSLRPESVSFVIDLKNDGRFDPLAGDFWAQVNLNPGPGTVSRIHLLTRGAAKEAKGASFVTETADEVTCRARIPLSNLPGVVSGPGNYVGFGVVFNDRGSHPTPWPPTFEKTPKSVIQDLRTAGEIAFSWRGEDGGLPLVFTRSLLKSEHVEKIVTTLPPGRAYMYAVFATEAEDPSDDPSSPEWERVVPDRVATGVAVDYVDVHARHFATRFTNLLDDPSFEALADEGPARLRRGESDLEVWQPDRPYCAADTKLAHSGRASAMIPAEGRSMAPPDRWSNWRQIVAADPDTEYTLSAYVKVGKMLDGNANIGVHTYDSTSNKPFSNHGSVRAVPEIADWQPLQMTFRTGPDEDRIRVFCDVDLNGVAWFDDVYLIPGSLSTGPAQVVDQAFIKKPGLFETPGQILPAR